MTSRIFPVPVSKTRATARASRHQRPTHPRVVAAIRLVKFRRRQLAAASATLVDLLREVRRNRAPRGLIQGVRAEE